MGPPMYHLCLCYLRWFLSNDLCKVLLIRVVIWTLEDGRYIKAKQLKLVIEESYERVISFTDWLDALA